MRFDDSLKTVLAADTATAFGAQSAFRQIVDLMGRGRIAADPDTIDRLRTLRATVPVTTRAASARALALCRPPAALVALFVEDEGIVATAALRVTTLDTEDWVALLPRIGPAGRSILRSRDDLPAAVVRALESFGSTDFTIAGTGPAIHSAEPVVQPFAPGWGPGQGPFVALGTIARELPVVAEALRQAVAPTPEPDTPPQIQPQTGPGFEIADLVDRIANFQRDRQKVAATPQASTAPTGFRFETDVDGVICWVDGVTRSPLVGLSLAAVSRGGMHHVDGIATGALRQRGAFCDARLRVGGTSDAAGDWRISGAPMFDPATGRFLGMRGAARRPRTDESAAPAASAPAAASRANSESLRRLVHELRTPTNAISGFAELIEGELLGPVAGVHRDRAGAIRAHTADLVAAIDDLDMAARIEGDALDLRPGQVALHPLLMQTAHDLAPLAGLRGCAIEIAADDDVMVVADDRAIARLIGRLMAALVSAGGTGERIAVSTVRQDNSVTIRFTRPAALTHVADEALLSIDAEREAMLPGAPLLGTGFALRLARNLARELGGRLTIATDRLTLRLPTSSSEDFGRASTN